MMFSQRTGFFPPTTTVTPFVSSQITTTTSIQYPYTQYSTSSLVYVGFEEISLARPVFLFIFVEPGTGFVKGQAIKINTDGTLLFGTMADLDTTGGAAHTVALTCELAGAGSFPPDTYQGPSVRWFCSYVRPGTQQLVALYGRVSVLSPDLTVQRTRAPFVVFSGVDGDFPAAAYLGRRAATTNPYPNGNQYQVLFGARTPGGYQTRRYYTDGSNDFIAQGPALTPNGGLTDPAALGFAADFSNVKVPVFRSAYWNTGGGGQTTVAAIMASQFSNLGTPTANNWPTQITTSPSILDTSVYNQACNLNNSNKFLGVSFLAPNSLNLTVVDVTWNTPPTFSTTTVGAFVSAGSAVMQPAVVSGFTTNTALLVQSPAGLTSLTYTPITVAGTVPTVGSTQTLFGGLSNCIGPPICATAKVGTKTYLVGIQSRSGSNTPYVFCVRFT